MIQQIFSPIRGKSRRFEAVLLVYCLLVSATLASDCTESLRQIADLAGNAESAASELDDAEDAVESARGDLESCKAGLLYGYDRDCSFYQRELRDALETLDSANAEATDVAYQLESEATSISAACRASGPSQLQVLMASLVKLQKSSQDCESRLLQSQSERASLAAALQEHNRRSISLDSQIAALQTERAQNKAAAELRLLQESACVQAASPESKWFKAGLNADRSKLWEALIQVVSSEKIAIISASEESGLLYSEVVAIRADGRVCPNYFGQAYLRYSVRIACTSSCELSVLASIQPACCSSTSMYERALLQRVANHLNSTSIDNSSTPERQEP